MADQQTDTEISLSTGKLLLLFFGLVVLCGAFFGVGYMIGKNSATPVATATDPSAATTVPGAPKPSSGVGAAVLPPKTQDCPSGVNCEQSPANPEMTFYKNVEQKEVNPQLEQPAPPATETKPAAQDQKPAPLSAPGPGYIVQIAAVSKQQDADTLVAALRKKQYPVFITSNPTTDKLFHVQAGPFADIKEAESMKTRLTNDGYSPILKR